MLIKIIDFRIRIKMKGNKQLEIAIIIPVYNKELTIKEVIKHFSEKCPQVKIYVIDNNSTDRTNEISKEIIRELGCKGEIIFEKRQGKGNAIRRAFINIDADIFIIVDADLTYSEKDLHNLLNPIINNECDMCIRNRHVDKNYSRVNKRLFHNFGNNLVKKFVNFIFKSNLKDIMSGYRVFNRFFVKNFPILSEGFEIETEMTLHALDKKYRIKEIGIEYSERPEGSFSKLKTVKDGIKAINIIFTIFKDYKPLQFFGFISILFFISGLIIGVPVVLEFLKTFYIKKVPSAILASGLIIISILLFGIDIILDSVSKYHRYNYELKLLDFKLHIKNRY